jgi:hypothetical protein
MKNIHILPTYKPSRLHSWGGVLKIVNSNLDLRLLYRNIYITSDEEINQQTEPCWCINTIKNTWDADLIYYQGSMPQYHYVGFKKIILTTDQDLIKDGVQAIDDGFLEWFIENPSCEEVEVDLFPKNSNKLYEIIIPKEEQKQHLIDMMKSDEIKLEDVFNDEKREAVKRVIMQHKALKSLSLVNPLHLEMTSDGHGEFPNAYKLTERGVQYIIEQLNK